MIISIPLDSPLLLFAAILIGIGTLATPFSARFGIICIGIGTVIMGAVVLATMPNGFESIGLWLLPFGFTIIVGIWMMMVGLRHPS